MSQSQSGCSARSVLSLKQPALPQLPPALDLHEPGGHRCFGQLVEAAQVSWLLSETPPDGTPLKLHEPHGCVLSARSGFEL